MYLYKISRKWERISLVISKDIKTFSLWSPAAECSENSQELVSTPFLYLTLYTKISSTIGIIKNRSGGIKIASWISCGTTQILLLTNKKKSLCYNLIKNKYLQNIFVLLTQFVRFYLTLVFNKYFLVKKTCQRNEGFFKFKSLHQELYYSYIEKLYSSAFSQFYFTIKLNKYILQQNKR